MKREKVKATVTFVPLTKEQREYGLKGAIEALDLILTSDLKRETIENERQKIKKQLDELTSG